MSYQLDLHKRPTTTARRTLAGQLEQAIGRLQVEPERDLRVALHGVRLDLKRSRSLLRLMRPALPVEIYEREMGARDRVPARYRLLVTPMCCRRR